MRKAMLALAAAMMLSGCASFFENSYDDAAREECDRSSRAEERGACYDRIEQERRERQRDD